jgi:putative heme-binding domain-containing protein
MRTARHNLPVTSVQISSDHRTLIINTQPQTQAVKHAITLANFHSTPTPQSDIPQVDALDLAYDQTGVELTFQPTNSAESITTWLPHPDLAVSRAFTTSSADHDQLWKLLKSPGRLTLQSNLDLWSMLHPAIQPGSTLDYTYPPEQVTLTFESNSPIELQTPNLKPQTSQETNLYRAALTLTPKEAELLPIRLTLDSKSPDPTLTVSFHTNEDPRPRALPLRRFFMPWTQLKPATTESLATAQDIPELKGGDWLRGKRLFFGTEAACSKCHAVRGEGSDLGPDLSNLIHRDYNSVLRDIRDPSGALNPEYLASIVKLKGGKVLSGIVRNTDATHFLVRGDADGEKKPISKTDVLKITPSPLSVMPKGIPEALGPDKMRDLLTFLLTQPLDPAPLEREGAPPPRTRAEIDAILNPASRLSPSPGTPGEGRGEGLPHSALRTQDSALHVLLVSGPKDHGPGEHDYPLFQKRWSRLLALADNVTVTTAEGWPTPDQFSHANTIVFYNANPAWTADKGKDLDAYLARGGGLVYLHFAVDGHDACQPLADRIGLAWRGGSSTFRHGPVDLTFPDPNHPITRGFTSAKFIDETYWQLIGDEKTIHLLASAPEAGAPRPLMWTREHDKGRIFVSILGHYTWTFDDPLFRTLILRAIAWTAHDNPDRLTDLATLGARMQ